MPSHPRLHHAAGSDSGSPGYGIGMRRKEGQRLDSGRSGVHFWPPPQTAAAVSEETPALSGLLFCRPQYSMGSIPRSVQTKAAPLSQPVSKPKVLICFDSWTVAESLVLTQILVPVPSTWMTRFPAPGRP